MFENLIGTLTKKIPHTGDTELIGQCRYMHRYQKKYIYIFLKADAPYFWKIVSLQANIRNTAFDQKSLRHLKVGNNKKQKLKKHFFFIVSSQAHIRNTFFNQKSPRHPEVGFFGLPV